MTATISRASHLLLRHAANSKGCDAPVAGLSSLAAGSAVINAKVLSASFYGREVEKRVRVEMWRRF